MEYMNRNNTCHDIMDHNPKDAGRWERHGFMWCYVMLVYSDVKWCPTFRWCWRAACWAHYRGPKAPWRGSWAASALESPLHHSSVHNTTTNHEHNITHHSMAQTMVQQNYGTTKRSQVQWRYPQTEHDYESRDQLLTHRQQAEWRGWGVITCILLTCHCWGCAMSSNICCVLVRWVLSCAVCFNFCGTGGSHEVDSMTWISTCGTVAWLTGYSIVEL